MAKMWITESVDPRGAHGLSGVIAMPPLAEQTVTFTTSTQSNAFNTATRLVRVQSDADCHVAVGADPTATTSGVPMTAGQAEYFAVTGGHKIAVIQA